MIRAGTAADLEAIGRMLGESSWRPAEFLAHRLVVAEEGGIVTGFAVARCVAAGEWELLEIAVGEPWRRRGWGERLLEQLLREHPGDWYLEVRTTNAAAQGLYQKLGFRAIGRRPGYYRNEALGKPEEGIVFHRHS